MKDVCLNPVITSAQVAHIAHLGQKRKYTGKPYITHPARVAARAMVYYVEPSMLSHHRAEDIFAAAWCHDVVEDTSYTFNDLLNRGLSTAAVDLCRELTNPSKGSNAPRSVRKQIDRDYLKDISHDGKILKLLDRLDNVVDMVYAPIDFLELYVRETELLVDVLISTDEKLAKEVLAEAHSSLKIAKLLNS